MVKWNKGFRKLGLKKGDTIRYVGGSSTHNLTIDKRYVLAEDPRWSRVLVKNDRGTKSRILSKYFVYGYSFDGCISENLMT